MLIGKLLKFLGYTNSSPANGELWYDGTDFNVRTGGATKALLSGTVPVANGGTGATTANAALNALLPSQTGNSGEFLTTDGTDASWGAPSLPSSFVGKAIAVVKTADETVTSSTSVQADDDLHFTIGANEVWTFRLDFKLSAHASGGWKWLLDVPSGAGAIGQGGGVNNYGLLTWEIDLTTGGGATAASTNTTGSPSLSIMGYVANGGNAGTVTLKWAQNASFGTGTILKRGSMLTAWRVS